jgi:hypothetical protein
MDGPLSHLSHEREVPDDRLESPYHAVTYYSNSIIADIDFSPTCQLCPMNPQYDNLSHRCIFFTVSQMQLMSDGACQVCMNVNILHICKISPR